MSSAPPPAMPASRPPQPQQPRQPQQHHQQSRGPRHLLSPRPSVWLHAYDDFITKNASQVAQIESALRSLTYIIPGRFRDAEIASEAVHSGVQLLSLYHDALLQRAPPRPPPLSPRLSTSSSSSSSPSSPTKPPPTLHSRYTHFWARRSRLYRRVALVLQVVQYTELLCEMAAKRRGERVRWRVIMLIEAVKACCRLLLLRVTRSRPLVVPPLPEREPVPEDTAENDEEEALLAAEEEETERAKTLAHGKDVGVIVNGNGHLERQRQAQEEPQVPAHERPWAMPRTGMSLPALPPGGDISAYLLGRVLTADDVKPANRLLPRLSGAARAAEVLHILAPLAYAAMLARSSARGNDTRRDWAPWLLGLAVALAARQLRELGPGGSSSTTGTMAASGTGAGGGAAARTVLERDEWSRRGWSLGWWAMRGAFYENVTRGAVEGFRRRVPGLVAGIVEDYEYLWENYYFSTST